MKMANNRVKSTNDKKKIPKRLANIKESATFALAITK